MYDDCIKKGVPIPLTSQCRSRKNTRMIGSTILHDALRGTHGLKADIIERLLAMEPKLLNIQDHSKDTPLFLFLEHISARFYGSENLPYVPDVLKVLAKFKMQIDFKLVNDRGETLFVCIDRLIKETKKSIAAPIKYESERFTLEKMKTALDALEKTKLFLQSCTAEYKADRKDAVSAAPSNPLRRSP